MRDRVFVDTNVLVYAEDLDAGRRHDVAKRWVKRLWQDAVGAVSIQVLQELFVTVTRKLPRPYPVEVARPIIGQYLHWHVIENDGALLLQAIDLQAANQLSFWDALIVQAAIRAQATLLLTEDLNHGQVIGGVEIHNPFLDPPAS